MSVEEEDTSVLGRLREDAKIEGYVAGTEAFERRVRQLQVTKCREYKGVFNCTECKFFDYCELIKVVMREQRGGK